MVIASMLICSSCKVCHTSTVLNTKCFYHWNLSEEIANVFYTAAKSESTVGQQALKGGSAITYGAIAMLKCVQVHSEDQSQAGRMLAALKSGTIRRSAKQ